MDKERLQQLAGILLTEREDKNIISPTEDLMREHGVLRRILIIYHEITWNYINKEKDFPHEALTDSAELLQEFIENYHEKIEEKYIFPRFVNHQHADLAKLLKQQHDIGRKMTKKIIALSKEKILDTDELKKLLRGVVDMQTAHAAREDTVLFPAFRKLVSVDELHDLAEKCEDMEHKLFGQNGFSDVVKRVAKIEKMLKIADLSVFTAKE